MVPPAPSLFSTTTDWPSVLLIDAAIERPTTSVGPPAANGTTSVTGRVGYPCASALPAAQASRIDNKVRRTVCMDLAPFGFSRIDLVRQRFRDFDQVEIGVAHVDRNQPVNRAGALDRTFDNRPVARTQMLD